MDCTRLHWTLSLSDRSDDDTRDGYSCLTDSFYLVVFVLALI